MCRRTTTITFRGGSAGCAGGVGWETGAGVPGSTAAEPVLTGRAGSTLASWEADAAIAAVICPVPKAASPDRNQRAARAG